MSIQQQVKNINRYIPKSVINLPLRKYFVTVQNLEHLLFMLVDALKFLNISIRS